MSYPSYYAALIEVQKQIVLRLIELQADPALKGAAAEIMTRQPAEAQRAARAELAERS